MICSTEANVLVSLMLDLNRVNAQLRNFIDEFIKNVIFSQIVFAADLLSGDIYFFLALRI